MNTVSFISGRLKARSSLATVSVAISALVMLLALFVSSGFRSAIMGSIVAVSVTVVIPVERFVRGKTLT